MENDADFTFNLLYGTSLLEVSESEPKTEDETIKNFEASVEGQTSTPKFVPHKRIRVFLDDAPESLRPLLSEEVSWSSSIFTPPRYTTSQQVSYEDSVCDYNLSVPFDETSNSVDKSSAFKDSTSDPDADYTRHEESIHSSKCKNTAEPCNVEKVDVMNEPRGTKTNVARKLFKATAHEKEHNHELDHSGNKESTVNKDFAKNKVHSLCDENVEGMQNISSISENPKNENRMESDIKQLCNLSEKDFSIWLDVTENCDKWIDSDEWLGKVDDKTPCSFVQSSVVEGNNDNVCSQRCNEHETCLEKQENSNIMQNKRVNNLQDKQDRRKFRLGLSESAKMKYINNSNSGTERVSGYVDNKQNNSDSKLTNSVSFLSKKYASGKLFWSTGIHSQKRVNDECRPLTTLPVTKRMKRCNADVSRDETTLRNIIQPKLNTSCDYEVTGYLPVCGSANIVKRSDAADKKNISSNSSDIHIIDSATDKIPETKIFDTVKRSNNNERLKESTKFQGFSTASGREVLVSKEALNKAKQFLSEKEIMKDAALSSISVDHLLNKDMLEIKRKRENEKKTTLQDNYSRLERVLPDTNRTFARTSLNSKQTPFHSNMSKVKVCNVDNKTNAEKYINKVSVIGERKALRPQNSFVNNNVSTIPKKVTSGIDSSRNFLSMKANKQDDLCAVTSISAVGDKSIKTQQVLNRGKKRPCEIVANEASNICGFSTASGKKVEVSKLALNRAKEILSDCDKLNTGLPLLNTNSKPCETNSRCAEIKETSRNSSSNLMTFSTATDNNSTVSKLSLNEMKGFPETKTQEELTVHPGKFNVAAYCNKMTNSRAELQGFSTANGIKVDVSGSALSKVKQIFSEEHLNINSLHKVHEIQKDLVCNIKDFPSADVEEQVVPENIHFMAHKRRKISISKSDKECKTGNLSYTSAVQCTTDGNKTSQVSKCNIEQISKKINLNRVISPEESPHSASGDGSGKSSWFEYNEQSINTRLNREMSLSDAPHFDYRHKNFTSKFQGLSTASGRKVSVPEKALSEARQLFVEADQIMSVTDKTDKLEDVFEHEMKQADKQNKVTCVTIHKKNGTEICPSKVLNVPLEADWNKELISMNSYTGNDTALQKFSDSSSNIHRHSTASSNKISVSDETLTDMKQMLFEDDFETEVLPNLNGEKFSNQDSTDKIKATQEKCYNPKYKTKEFQKSACETVNFCDGHLESSNKPHSDKSILKHEFENNNMFNSTSDQTEPSVESTCSPVLETLNVHRPDRGKYNKNIIDNASLETHVSDKFDFTTSPVIGSNNKNICHVNSKTATIDLEKHKDVTIKDICSLASDQTRVKRAQSSENIRRIKKCLFEIPKSSSVFNAGSDTTHIKMKPESKSSTRNISINSNLSKGLDETGSAMVNLVDEELECASLAEKSYPVTSYVSSLDIFEDRSASPVVSFVKNPVVGLESRYNLDHSKHLVDSSTDDQEVRCQNETPIPNTSSVLHPRKVHFRFKTRKILQYLDSQRNSTHNETDPNSMEALVDQEMRIEEGRNTGVRSYKGSYFQKRKDNKLVPLKDVVSGHFPGTYSSKELIQMGIKDAVVNVTAMNAVDYRFSINDFCSSRDSVGISTEDGALLVPDHDGFIGVKEFTRAFLSCSGVDPSLSLHENWISNHYRWIVWKLASTERSFPQHFSGYLSPNNVMAQLRYRYDREMVCNQRPALRKILERDDASTKRLVLCVANITKKPDVRVPSESKSPELSDYELELTDGWYSVMAAVDVEMTRLIESHRVTVGTKLMTCGAELVNCSQGCSPLEADQNVRLKIHTNSTRRARWCTKLGFQSNPNAFPISLSSVLPNGGLISCVPVIIARVYPIMYLEKLSNGKTVYRGARAEEREAAKFEKQRQDKAEKVLSQLRAEIIDKNLLAEEQKQELIRVKQMQAKLREELEDVSRNVVPILKVRCLDANNLDKENGSAVLSVWRASEDVMNIFKEGTSLKIFKIDKSGYSSKKGSLLLSSSRNTRYEPLEQNVVYPERRVTELRCLADIASFRPLFGEVDIVGVVVCTRVNSSNSETVYMADGTSLAAISFWGSVKDFGYEGILMPEKVIAASNLHWLPTGDSRIPNIRASEVSVFSQNPHQRYLREALESLQEKIGPNVKSFVLQCKELIDKPEKAGTNNTSTHSNTTNMSLPVTSCEKNSTKSVNSVSLAAPTILEQKLEKLEQYGEPSPPPPVHLPSRKSLSLSSRSKILSLSSRQVQQTNFKVPFQPVAPKSSPLSLSTPSD